MGKSEDNPGAFSIRLSKESFTFSAAHFITYDGETCEPLHGHNYRLSVELAGPVDENAYVFDFIATRDAIQQVVARLDHRVLLPTEHKLISVETVKEGGPAEVTARFQDRRWVFPESDCCLLPVPNTTAEMLARWIGERIAEAVPRATGLMIEVEECAGQAAQWRSSSR